MKSKGKYRITIIGLICLFFSNIHAIDISTIDFIHQKIFYLDVNEEYVFTLNNNSTRTIKLINYTEYRDSVNNKIRMSDVLITFDGRPLKLRCEPYTMPREISGIRIQADTTDGWLSSMPKNVQFSIWDANDPIIDTAYFSFPIENYVLFSHGTQSYNEVVHLGSVDDTPIGPNFFHNYGEDFGGYEGGHNILSWTDGEVVAFWPDERNKCGIKIKGPNNIYWEFLHLDSVAPGVAVGSILNKGDLIGKLGKTGPSGNFAHLHLGLLDYDTIWREIRYINLYPWIVSVYEAQFGKNLYAIARPHKIGMVGETITFDGNKSLAFNSTVRSYKWTFDDGLEIKAAAAKRTFDCPGCYSAVLKITDNRGNEDIDFCTVTIFNSAILDSRKFIPRIYMTYFPTMNIRAGENIKFRCWVQGKSSSLSTTKFNLDFGDGTILHNCNSYAAINHSFQTKGIHIVKAYATINGLDITQRIKVVIP